MRYSGIICLLLFIQNIAWAQEESPDVRIAKATIQIRTQPDSATGYINRSRAYNDKDQFDAALNDCRTALRLSPGNPYALKQRGYAYMEKQQLDSSKTDLTKSITAFTS